MSPFRSPPPERFERVANFRDLGGHTTQDGRRLCHGRLFRSGHLADCSDADLQVLGDLGIRRVFDFRSGHDIEVDGPDRVPAGVQHERLPMPDPAAGEDIRKLIRLNEGTQGGLEAVFGDGKAAAMMVRSAASMVHERKAPFSQFLAQLAQTDSVPALFHCSAGKDRAGWAGSLVLLTLGIDEEQVIEQYLLSNRELAGIRERLGPNGPSEWTDLLLPFLEVRTEYIEASFAAVRAGWGSFDRYLREALDISDEQRESLKESLLD